MQSRCYPPADAPETIRWLLAGLPLEMWQPLRARPRPVARRYSKDRNRRRGQQRSHRQSRSGPPAARHRRPQRSPAQSTSKCSIAAFLVEEHGHEERGKDLSDGSRSGTNFSFFDHRLGLALRVTTIVLDATDEGA